ncbi:hypothetical protein [Desulfocicer niacini]
MASADFCLVTRQVTLKGAMKFLLQVLPVVCIPVWSRPGIIAKKKSMHAKQISPDKNVNCHYTTAAFTLSPESWALSCVADLPGDQALYAVFTMSDLFPPLCRLARRVMYDLLFECASKTPLSNGPIFA